MSSVQPQRASINEQETVAEERSPEFKEIIVKSEEDIDDLPQYYACKDNQQLSNQEKKTSLDMDEAEPLQMKRDQEEQEHQLVKDEQGELVHLEIKEEEEELCITQDQEGLVLKQETDALKKTFSNKKKSSTKYNRNNLDSQKVPEAEKQDQEKNSPEGSGSKRDEEPKQSNSLLKTHTFKNLYSCKICGKIFPQNSHLTRHMRIHTGEKPFSCVTCGKSFSQKGNLAYHMKGHTGEKPFSCITCGKSFSFKSILLIHARIHTAEKPFSCMTCGKSFTQKSSLTYHMRVHTGEKPFSCMFCGKTFRQRSKLTRHTRIHTGEKA
ncbi:hypothetical protein XENORESO_010699 [Xenotaenia resolanae]|uniref:C2H2-type domain-containing protein n=1 Tax=Xenotaenia resolanae TaxID=208358 RepID=A0ABV0X7W3_9TELE